MADKKQRTPERQMQVEARARRMERTRNARNWNNPDADLTKSQRVRGMARASVAEAIGEKFGIIGQRASDKLKGKTGPTIGQMARSVGKQTIAEKFGPLGTIATIGKKQNKDSVSKIKSESVTEKTSEQLTDVKNSNANNTIMLRNMNGSLRSIDQKLEDILFSQERMENMLNRMIMDKSASKRSNLGEANLQDPYEDDNNLDLNLDIGRKRKRIPRRPRPRPQVRPGFLGSAGRLAMGAGRLALAASPFALGAAAVGGIGALAYNAGQARKEKPEEAEQFDRTLKTGGARSQVIQGPEAERQQFPDTPLPARKLTPSELLKKFNLTQNDVASIRGNVINLKDGRKIDTVKQTFVNDKGEPVSYSTIPVVSSNNEEYDADIEKLKPAWEQKNPDGTWKNKFTGPDGKEITDPEERKKFQSRTANDLASRIAGRPVTPSPDVSTIKTPDATKTGDTPVPTPTAPVPIEKPKPLPIERYDSGADFREAEVVMQDAAISSKDPREHLIAAVKSGKIKDYNSFMEGIRAAISAAGIKNNRDIESSRLRLWAFSKVAEARGGQTSGSGPELVEAFIKLYGGTPDTSRLDAEKSFIEEMKKQMSGEPQTGQATTQTPPPPSAESTTPPPSPAPQPPPADGGGTVAAPAPGATPSVGGATATPPAGGGATQAGPPSPVTPSAGGDKGATPRSGSEQSLLNAAKAAGISDPTELAQFMAQMAHESGNFRYLQEIWGPTAAQARYEGRKDLGNVQRGDGYRFRGRGYVQLTGRANYRSFGSMIGVDLENNPDIASQPDIAARLAVAYWKTRVKSKVRDFENTRLVTRLINGGFNGLADREAKFKKYKEQKDLGGSQGAAAAASGGGVGAVAAPGAEGGSATSPPSVAGGAGGAGGVGGAGGSTMPTAGGAGGGGGAGVMPGVDPMGNVTGMPQAGVGAPAPGAGPGGGPQAGPPQLAPPGAGGPAVQGAGLAAGDKSGQNGMLPPSSLAPVGIGQHKAQPVAADAFKAMRAAAQKDKVDLGITDSYRSYAAQVDVKRRKPNLAATPGRSNHGWGLAFDMSFGSNQNSPGYKWMVQNASKFGFKGPLQKPFEPWHWEYVGGGSKDAMAAAGAGGTDTKAAPGAEGGGASAPPSSMPGGGAAGGGTMAGGSESGGAAATPAVGGGGGGGGGAPALAENTARPATTPVETGADLNRRSTDVELSKSSTQPPIVVAGGAGEKAGHTVPNPGGVNEGAPLSAVPQGGFAEQLASGISGSLVESTGSNSMSMNRRAAGGSMVA